MLPTVKLLRFCIGFRVISRSVHFRTRNPTEPHYDRKRMLEVCKPIYMPETVPEHLTCPQAFLADHEEPHPYDVILSNELKEKVDASKMILIYHVNSITNEEEKTIYRAFFKQDFSFHIYNINVLRLGLEGTKYQTILQLFESSSGLVFCSDVSLGNALKLSKQLQDKLLLLAGVIEGQLYSRSHLSSINQLLKRNIYGEMVHQIRSPATSIYRSLNYQMNLLSHNLKEISKGEE